jgi:hypothetical protein
MCDSTQRRTPRPPRRPIGFGFFAPAEHRDIPSPPHTAGLGSSHPDRPAPAIFGIRTPPQQGDRLAPAIFGIRTPPPQGAAHAARLPPAEQGEMAPLRPALRSAPPLPRLIAACASPRLQNVEIFHILTTQGEASVPGESRMSPFFEKRPY